MADNKDMEEIDAMLDLVNALKKSVPTSVKHLVGIEEALKQERLFRKAGVPDSIKVTERQQPESVAVLTCPVCEVQRFAPQTFADFLTVLKEIPDDEGLIAGALPRHIPCDAIMTMRLLTEEERDMVTADDLKRIFFRAQTTEGRWVSIDAFSASDKQFDTWAKSRIEIKGEDNPWTLEERADFCNMLWQRKALVMLNA